ncbi:PREDICTED: uncharacterized protein LOC105368471 [Ceratosolen solmsi marchali]|uniref:Uncharacterized protein LOC105368471 n=1 Tax=Ceratosolen solmsi marchali TaxID=326594 RepID=A0AAJ6YWP0_9HYME|nr:PREDICTED: uncharacterized protein LOC105368471 [Ceratosolen solmsi marchali]
MNVARKEYGLTDYFKYQVIIISGNKYLIGVRKNKELREVLLTNLIDYYTENLLVDDIIKRCQDLNPVFSDTIFEDLVDDILVNISKYIVSSTKDNIELETKIENGRFLFRICLTKTNPEYFNSYFNEHFYSAFSELYHRYSYLLNIIKKKDAEIEEYKAQGINIIKKALVTELFNENLFYTELKNVKSSDKISTFLDIMNFYNAVRDLQFNNFNPKQTVESASNILNSNFYSFSIF